MPLIAREIAKPSVIAAISTLIGFFMKSLLIIFLLQQKSEHRGSWVERNPNRRLCLGSLVPCPSSLVLSTEPTAPCLPGHSAIGSGTRFQILLVFFVDGPEFVSFRFGQFHIFRNDQLFIRLELLMDDFQIARRLVALRRFCLRESCHRCKAQKPASKQRNHRPAESYDSYIHTPLLLFG